MEKEQRELLAQQQETRCKMAALINAVSTGHLKATETPNYQPVMAAPEASNQPETTEKVRSSLTNPRINNSDAQFSRPYHWQVMQRSKYKAGRRYRADGKNVGEKYEM